MKKMPRPVNKGEYVYAYKFKISFLHPKYWLWWLGIGLIGLISQLPRQFVKKLTAKLGFISYKLMSRRTHIARKNIELCFQELSKEEKEQILLKNNQYLIQAVFDTGMAWFSSSRRIKSFSKIIGMEHIENAMHGEKGVLFCACHMVHIEMLMRVFSEVKPWNTLYRVHDNPVFEYCSGLARRNYPNHCRFIPRKKVRELLYYLTKGEIGVILADHDLGSQTFVPFFGIPTSTITSVSDFAKIAKVKVIMVDHYMEDDTYIIKFSPHLDNFPTIDKTADAARINGLYEQQIRQHPEQYLWQHRRFKTRPPKESLTFY